MFKKIIVGLLVAYAALSAYEAPKEMKYFININQKFKGVLLLNSEDKTTNIKYFNITSRDKIPFFAPSKEFTFTSLNKIPTLKTLDVGSLNKHMVYNLSSLSADAIEEADISKEDISQSAIIYNADNLPSEVVEKRLIHTIESLILSIFETKKIPKNAFYLYEPHKKMLIKVKFAQEGRDSVSFDGLDCDTKTYVLKIAGRDKRLIRVYTNSYPVKIESYSKKWSFVLAGAGEPKKITFSNQEMAFKVFKDEVLDRYADYNVKILGQSVKTDVFAKKYFTKFHVWKELNKEEMKNATLKYTNRNINMKYMRTKKGALVFWVDNDEVMDLLEDKYDVEDSKYYWKKDALWMSAIELLKFSAKEKKCKISNGLNNDSTIICKGKKIRVNYEDALEKYYKGKFKEFKISNVNEIDDGFDHIQKIKFTLKALHKLNNDIIYDFAVKAMQKKYPKNKFSNSLQFVKSEDKWSVYLSKQAVFDKGCKNIIPLVDSKYKNGKCQTTVNMIKTDEDAQNIVSNFIAKNYKDIDILGTKVHYGNDNVSFKYLKGSKKVQNACK